MKPKRIILIRHGESEGNVDPEVHSWKPDHKIQLTVKGREQAYDAGLTLRDLLGTNNSNRTPVVNEILFTPKQKAHFYVSPHMRSRQTYEHIAVAVPGRMYEDPRLREQEWGHFRTRAETDKIEKERYEYGTFYYRFPNGESGADVYDRVSGFLETLWRDFSKDEYPENAVIVTHGLTIRLFIMRWFHISVDEYESWANPANCQAFVMDCVQGRYTKPRMIIKK